MNEAQQYDQKALAEIVVLFNEAEEAIKYIEDFGENLIVPAVNQLRYTGNHLVRYLSSSQNSEELKDAAKHVKRATYDAYEAVILQGKRMTFAVNIVNDELIIITTSIIVKNYQ